jgi:flagellar motor switch protein FliM
LNPTDDARLSEEEIAALSKTFQAAQDPNGAGSPGDPRARPLDLVGMTSVARTTGQAPALDLIHEEFGRHLETQLERLTREHGSCVAEKPEVQSFAEVYGGLAMPSTIVVVDIIGFATSGLVVMDPKLLFHIIDLTMGGPGGDCGADEMLQHRSFTSAERRLIGKIVTMVENALQNAWRDITSLGLRVLRAEVDPRHAAILRPGDAVIKFPVRVRWNTVEGKILFVVPVIALRPFDEKLSATAIKTETSLERSWRSQLVELMKEVPLEATAVLGSSQVKLRDLLSLDVGSVLRLNTDPTSSVDVTLGGLVRFRGVPTSHLGNVAINITDVLDKENKS